MLYCALFTQVCTKKIGEEEFPQRGETGTRTILFYGISSSSHLPLLLNSIATIYVISQIASCYFEKLKLGGNRKNYHFRFKVSPFLSGKASVCTNCQSSSHYTFWETSKWSCFWKTLFEESNTLQALCVFQSLVILTISFAFIHPVMEHFNPKAHNCLWRYITDANMKC